MLSVTMSYKRPAAGLLGVLMIFCLLPIQLRAEETIRWAKLDFPPFEINEGQFANKGIVNLVKQFVQANLAAYQHTDVSLIMNVERMMTEFTTGNLCYPAVLRNPALEETTYLSIGIGIMSAQSLITTQSTYAAKFTQQAEYSLQQLLANEALVFGVPTGSMGQIFDSIIAQHAQQKNVYVRKSAEVKGLFDMLAAKRIDYTLGYPAEAVFWNMQHPEYQLVVLPTTETAGQYTIGRVACTKNDWGKAIITQVNAILMERRMQETYIKDIFLPWIPEEMQADYLRDYQRILAEDTWTNVN